MTHEKLMRLARKAGFPDWWLCPVANGKRAESALLRLRRFAILVAEDRAKAERNRIAMLVAAQEWIHPKDIAASILSEAAKQ